MYKYYNNCRILFGWAMKAHPGFMVATEALAGVTGFKIGGFLKNEYLGALGQIFKDQNLRAEYLNCVNELRIFIKYDMILEDEGLKRNDENVIESVTNDWK